MIAVISIILVTVIVVEDGEERVSRAVFIGRDMPEEMIRKGFAECVA